MGIGSNRSRTGKPATLCELRTRMRDLDQSSRITIPASGFCKCRMKRPDRRAHSIPSSYGKFSSCVAGGNHRREITVLPPNPIGAFGVNRKTQPLPGRSLGCGTPANDGPLAGACHSSRGTSCTARVRDGDGAVGKSAGGPSREAPHPQEQPEGRAGPSASILTGPLILKCKDKASSRDWESKHGHGIRRPDAALLRDR